MSKTDKTRFIQLTEDETKTMTMTVTMQYEPVRIEKGKRYIIETRTEDGYLKIIEVYLKQ